MSTEYGPTPEQMGFKSEVKNPQPETPSTGSSENQTVPAQEQPVPVGPEKILPRKNYYDILGVSNNAPSQEIETAFKKLRTEHHPDRTGGIETDAFKEAMMAYGALNSQSSRTSYDQLLADTIATTNNYSNNRIDERWRQFNADLQEYLSNINKREQEYWLKFGEKEKDYWSAFGKE